MDVPSQPAAAIGASGAYADAAAEPESVMFFGADAGIAMPVLLSLVLAIALFATSGRRGGLSKNAETSVKPSWSLERCMFLFEMWTGTYTLDRWEKAVFNTFFLLTTWGFSYTMYGAIGLLRRALSVIVELYLS